MTQENEMNHDGDGFEAAPNMVPGEVEAAEQFDPTKGPVRRKGMKAKLFFVFAGLLFAGGWGYANKEDFKDALGLQAEVKKQMASTSDDGEIVHGCCPEMTAEATGEHTACQEGSCPLAAEADAEAVAKKGTCCEDGRKKAMIAALLEGTDEKTENEGEASEEKAAPKPETAAEDVTTPEQKEAPAKDSEQVESKKAEAETQPATAK